VDVSNLVDVVIDGSIQRYWLMQNRTGITQWFSHFNDNGTAFSFLEETIISRTHRHWH